MSSSSSLSSSLTSSTETFSSTYTSKSEVNSTEIYPLPKSPRVASHLYVASDTSWGFTLTALQGLVARQSPQIFFVANSLDRSYLNQIEQQYNITSESDSAQQILQRFVTAQYVSQTNGKFNIIVFDSNEPASDYYWETNTARTIAGVTGALPVGSAQLGQFESWFPNSNIIYDLRTMYPETSAGAISGYQWAWNTFGPQTTRQFMTMSPNGRYMGGDYEVEFKSFVFSFCDPNVASGCTFDATQQALATTILNAYPPGAVSMGFFGLGGEACSTCTINMLSQHGMTQDNSELSTNLSLYAGLPTIQAASPPAVANMTYDPKKKYVLWEYSQGDADTYEFYAIQHIYQEIDPKTNVPFRDEIPVSIQLKTMMAQTAPPVLSMYYSDPHSQADFMSAPSGGAGYQHPESMPSGTGTGSEYWFVQLSKTLNENVGVKNVFIIWGGGVSNTNVERYLSDWGSPQPNALFFWQNSGHAPMMCNAQTCTSGALAGGVPVFYSSFWQPNCLYAGVGGGSTCSVSGTASSIQSSGQWVNIIMNTQFPGYQFINDVMQQLGPSYVAVNAQQYTSLYRWESRLHPRIQRLRAPLP